MKSGEWFVTGLVVVVATGTGCFALDWDFNGAAGVGGSGGEAGESSSSSSSSSSSGSSSSVSSSSSSSSGAPSNEDCTNGIDDDSDGKVDCGDSDCGVLYECAVAVPAGWDPFWVIDTAYQEPSQTLCPDGHPATVLFAEPATTTTCSACTCSYSGATCSAPKFQCDYFSSSTCAGGDVLYQSNTTNCYPLPNVPQGGNFGSCKIIASPAVLNAGTCTGGASTVTGPPAFTKELRLCSTSDAQGKGCSLGDACGPKKPGILSAARTCIAQAGAAACPMGWAASNEVGFESGADGRTCSNCGCNTSSVTCSGGKVTMYGDNGCANSTKVLSALQQCVTNIPIMFQASANFVLGTPNSGTCTQATPSGSVQTTGPHTICCRD